MNIIESSTVISDSGRVAAGFPHESKDCTVRAIAEAYAVDYAVAHAACKRAGRKDRKGMTGFCTKVSTGKFFELGLHTMLPEFSTRRLSTVLPRLNPARRYMVLVSGHTFAVTGGKIKDSFVNRAGRIVKAIWQIEPLSTWPRRPLLAAPKESISAEQASAIRWSAVWNWKF